MRSMFMCLKSSIEKTVASWQFSESLPTPSGGVEFHAFRTTYSNLKKLSSGVVKAIFVRSLAKPGAGLVPPAKQPPLLP